MRKITRHMGTFTPRGFQGRVFVKKADIPQVILSMAGRGPAPMRAEWIEVAPWGSCKLLARKSGAVMQYAHQHYGYYDCCKKAGVELQGHDVYGVSKASMPIWARNALEFAILDHWGEAMGFKVKSWTRTNLDTMIVVVESPKTGFQWEVGISRHRSVRPNVRLVVGNSMEEILQLLNVA